MDPRKMNLQQFQMPPMKPPGEWDMQTPDQAMARQPPKYYGDGPGFSVPSAEGLGGNPMEQAKLLHSLGLSPSPKMQAASAPPSGDMGAIPGPPSLMPPRMDDAGVAVSPNELARRFKSGGMADIPTEKLMSAFIETGAKDQEIMAELVKRLSGPQPGM
jgi:hypothetical protein